MWQLDNDATPTLEYVVMSISQTISVPANNVLQLWANNANRVGQSLINYQGRVMLNATVLEIDNNCLTLIIKHDARNFNKQYELRVYDKSDYTATSVWISANAVNRLTRFFEING